MIQQLGLELVTMKEKDFHNCLGILTQGGNEYYANSEYIKNEFAQNQEIRKLVLQVIELQFCQKLSLQLLFRHYISDFSDY